MRTFKEYLQEKRVKKESPNPAEADSLMKQATERLDDLLTLLLNDKNASFRFESAYECLREAIQSFMALDGFNPYSHEAIVAYAAEKGLLNEREFITLDRHREKRNDINYRGQKVTIDEAKQIISFAREIISRLKNKFLEIKKA